MTRRRWLLISCWGVASLLSPWNDSTASAASGKSVLAIVTQKGSALEGLTLRELKRLYLGEHLGAPDGKRLMPLNQAASSPQRVGFERLVLGMSPDEATRFWIDRKIRGQSGPPKSVPSVELLRRVVASLPGAVTYLERAEVVGDLKVLKIDGKAPGDPGYPLEF
jgi:hypothetical protein